MMLTVQRHEVRQGYQDRFAIGLISLLKKAENFVFRLFFV